MKKVIIMMFIVSLFFIVSACSDSTELTNITGQTTIETTESPSETTEPDTQTSVDETTTEVDTTTEIDTTTEDAVKTLVSIEVTDGPDKDIYIEGEDFDHTGLVVMANYEWSNDQTTSMDVTSQVSFDKGELALGDDQVVVSYTEGSVTVTTTIDIQVNPIAPLIGDGLIIEMPTSGLEIETESTNGRARSYWFTEYQETVFYIKVIVQDGSIEDGPSMYSSDGIEVQIFNGQRGMGLIDGTLMINATPFGDLNVMSADQGTYQPVGDSAIVSEVNYVSFGGTYVEGYQIELEIPYSELGLSDMEKDVVFLPGLYNNQGSMANISYLESFGSDIEQTHTFVLVADDNSYQAHPWLQLGFTFGDIGDLETVGGWDLTNDDGSETASAVLDEITAGTDNNAYMYKLTETELYTHIELSATEVLNGEQYGKFGLMVSTLDGLNGFFFFVDALGDGTNMTGTNIGVVPRVNGEWVFSSASNVATLDSADAYQNGGFVDLAIYRTGSVFEFFVNGESVALKSGFSGLDEIAEAVVSVISFNITLVAQNYGITNDETVLSNYRFQTEEITNLFIGDSYIDTAFWADFDLAFPTDSVNWGIGGTTAEDWLGQIATLSSLYTPDNLIIHVGVNDINGGLSGQDTLEDIQALLEEIQILYPETHIYFISIEPNNFMPNNFVEYQVTNQGLETLAETNDQLTYIDTVTPLGGQSGISVAQYFGMDGLHLNEDGYAVWTKAIQEAMGISRVNVQDGLGDFEDYARSAGWVYGTEYIENVGINEQQIYFDGISGTEFAASIDLSVEGILNSDQFPKVGFALKSDAKTLLFFIDVNETIDNNWGNYVVRAVGEDWAWGDIGSRQYVNLGTSAYNTGNYKTLEIVRMGTAIYFIADGRIVQYVEGVFASDESTQLSVMTFNLNVRLKNATIFTGENLSSKTAAYEIAAKTGSMIDGDISDWATSVLDNPFTIPASDGRRINIYAYLADDGMYIAYDALIANGFVTNAGNWWENTNAEFKIGLDNQRFASANGSFSRYEDWGGRDIGMAVWSLDETGELNNAIVEMFIPWGMIEGFNKDSAFVPSGFAWKNPGEEGNLWVNGDFWYVPEADPGMRNVLITSTGVYQPQDVTIDGDAGDWDSTVLSTIWSGTPGDGRLYQSVAYVGTDGFYGMFAVQTPDPLDLSTTNRSDNWWQNPNIEVWVNDQHARIMMYNNMVTATGRITDVAYTYDEVNNLLLVEFFVPFHALGLDNTTTTLNFRIGSNSLNGGWFMPVDPNQVVTSSGLPAQP